MEFDTGLQLEFEEQEDLHAQKMQGEQKSRERWVKTRDKAFTQRGFRGHLPKQFDPSSGFRREARMVPAQVVRLARRYRIHHGSTEGQSHAFQNFADSEGLKKKTRAKKREPWGQSRAPAPSSSSVPQASPAKVQTLQQILSRYKRTGDLPAIPLTEIEQMDAAGVNKDLLRRMLNTLRLKASGEADCKPRRKEEKNSRLAAGVGEMLLIMATPDLENPGPPSTCDGEGTSAAPPIVCANCHGKGHDESACHKRKRPTGRQKSEHAKAKRASGALSKVTEALDDEHQKLQGAKDAKEERLTEEERAAAAEAARVKRSKMLDARVACYMQLPAEFFILYTDSGARESFLPFDLPIDLASLQTTPNCARRREDLKVPLLPHCILRVNHSVFSNGLARVGAGELECPAARVENPLSEDQRPVQCRGTKLDARPEDYVLVSYDVHAEQHRADGSLIGERDIEGGVFFNIDSLVEAQRRRLVIGNDFPKTLQAVMAYRSASHKLFNTRFSQFDSDRLADNVFCALLMLRSLCQPRFTLINVCEREAAGLLAEVNRHRPIAGGNYVVGYDVSTRDCFGPDFVGPRVSRASGAVQHGVHRTQELFRRGLAHCRMAPWSLAGILPAFPNPYNPNNRALGVAKRLAITRLTATEAARNLLTRIAGAMIRRIRSETHVVITKEEVFAACKANATEKFGMGTPDYLAYMEGVHAWAEDKEDTFDWRDEFLNVERQYQTISRDGTGHACFTKAEQLDPAKKKPPRYIISPCPTIRGFMHALLYRAQHTLFTVFGQEAVKYLDTAARSEAIAERFRDARYVLESDFTSMESNVNSFMIGLEGDILQNCDLTESRICSIFRMLSSVTTECRGAYETLFLEPMRLSGQEHTSSGNFICNRMWIHAALALYQSKRDAEIELPHCLN